MFDPKSIPTTTFNYDLPHEHIAQFPLEQRDASKLLVYRNGQIQDCNFKDLAAQLPAQLGLVFNNTKVIKARIECRKKTGAAIEIFCLEPAQPADYGQMFAATHKVVWRCIVGNLKKWKGESLIKSITIDGNTFDCYIDHITSENEQHLIQFSWTTDYCFAQILHEIGNIPIPPYLQRSANEHDTLRYQTVYAQWQGSVAAPTAGLHFTNTILKHLAQKGITTHQLTLHVGAGTFKPMKSDFVGDHQMHAEHCIVQLSQLKDIIAQVPQMVAVGTTSVRTLESLYWIGVKLLCTAENPFSLSQWELYDKLPQNVAPQDALQAVCNWLDSTNNSFVEFDTSLMIVPGYRFRTICGIITNFHQPQSTLLLLVAAAIGNDWQKVYQHALANKYRFLSYGDSSLLWLQEL